MKPLAPVTPMLSRLVVRGPHLQLKPIPAPVAHPRVGICGMIVPLMMSGAIWWGVARLAHLFI